jgi:hypothetical protein
LKGKDRKIFFFLVVIVRKFSFRRGEIYFCGGEIYFREGVFKERWRVFSGNISFMHEKSDVFLIFVKLNNLSTYENIIYIRIVPFVLDGHICPVEAGWRPYQDSMG